MQIEQENTFRRASADAVNLFLGAGFSVLAADEKGNPMPSGGELAEELIREFGVPELADLPLSQICTVLESTRREALRGFLKARFTVSSYDDRYDALHRVSIRSIFTTNIDDLVYRIFEGSKTQYINDITMRGPVSDDRSEISYAPLHGCVLREDSSFSFTPMDVSSSFSLDPDKWHFLTQRIQQVPTLFWGYALSDAGVLQALNPVTIQGREHQQKWILLRTPSPGEIEYFRALNFAIITGSTDELLDYIAQHCAPRAVSRPAIGAPTAELFPKETIPDIAQVPVRPLMEFYLGGEPTWHDVFSGHLYKTSHYATVVDSINSGANTVVIGIPGSGKTTLMMQVAAEISFHGHKLIFDAPSPEKAELVVRKLDGATTLCFVDNFTDYVDAFSLLSAAPNITAVGFDRDHNFEIASHRLDRSGVSIIDVTDLTNRDLQELYSHIPTQVRNPKLLRPQTEEGLFPSLYETVTRNVRDANIGDRFSNALTRLRCESQSLHDLLVVCCYVHTCRTPVSFDMVYAFMRDEVADWQDIYPWIRKLGALVTEYSGGFIDSDQDHFIARSSIVSASVMTRVRSADLKRILLRFHQEVSPLRICNYDVFRRSAYDASIIGKAFQDADEGKSFYERIYTRDDSPYLLQQGALYLSKKNRTRDAFSWIDKAVTDTRGRIPTIRNSHAVILFRANIRSGGDPELVARTLKQSMDILAECYTSDRRKAYHAAIFADQALEYWDVYGDETAKGYLVTAKSWLDAERKRSPWHRNVRRLHGVVLRRLERIG